MGIRVRFAPSPTGHLHIGGARTALFNWLFAKHNNGSFILRIEDTDRTRSTEEYIQSIIEGMQWLNLDWDEGPHRQTERLSVYQTYTEKLLEQGKAYYCYCSPEELEQRRKEALSQGKTPKYDGRCRSITEPLPDKNPVVRFMMPQQGETAIQDLVKGRVVFENAQLDDLIIRRSDGTPTYNFTVVVDDVDMLITHVIRGDDHLNNTPKQVHIYNALGYSVPSFAHLPMILGSDKARLSKRHGATSVTAYKEMGYLPHALVNYLARLGWSHGDQEIFTRDEMIEYFSFEHIGSSSSVFNPEKLLWLNSQYIMKTDNGQLAELVLPFLQSTDVIGENQDIDKTWLAQAVGTLRERSKTLVELAGALTYYISDEIEYDPKAQKKFLNTDILPYLKEVKDSLEQTDVFLADKIHRNFTEIVEKHGIKLGKLAQPVRVAVTGRKESPGIFEVLEVLGKEKTLRRLEHACRIIQTAGSHNE